MFTHVFVMCPSICDINNYHTWCGAHIENTRVILEVFQCPTEYGPELKAYVNVGINMYILCKSVHPTVWPLLLTRGARYISVSSIHQRTILCSSLNA